jgi:HK97 family phage major capsid protein
LISAPLALGLAMPILALMIVALIALAHSSPSGAILAVSPVLVVREKIARQVKTMQDYLKEHNAAWKPENQVDYDKMNTDLAPMLSEKQRLENVESLAALSSQNLETANHPPRTIGAPEGDGAAKPAESFGDYLKGVRRNRRTGVLEVRGMSAEKLAANLDLHHEAFMAYIAGDVSGLQSFAQQRGIGPREVHALLSSDQTLGGFLVPEDWRAEVIKAEAGYAVLAPLCRVITTNSDTLTMPKVTPHATDVRRTSGFAGKFQQQGYVTGGTAPTVQNYPQFSRERIPVHSWQPDCVEISPELLEDSGVNLEQLVSECIAEALAFDKDDKILSGTGVKEPEGVLNAGITTINSQSATAIAIGGILGQFSDLPAQYRMRATWVMASRTMGAVLQLNTGTGGWYLFPPNQWNDTILSRPVKFLDYGMDTATAAGGTTFTAGAYPIIFGDFSRYIIAERAALRIQRLIERFAPNVGILPTARIGGQVVLIDAFRVMKVSA